MAPVPGSAVLYPDRLPLDDAREIVRIIRSGGVMAERSALAKHVWVLQGYAQGALLGDPANLYVFSAQLPPDDSAAADALEQLMRAEEARLAGLPATQALPAPLALILQWAIRKLVELVAAELGINISF